MGHYSKKTKKGAHYTHELGNNCMNRSDEQDMFDQLHRFQLGKTGLPMSVIKLKVILSNNVGQVVAKTQTIERSKTWKNLSLNSLWSITEQNCTI